jgi:hypothetical protein
MRGWSLWRVRVCDCARSCLRVGVAEIASLWLGWAWICLDYHDTWVHICDDFISFLLFWHILHHRLFILGRRFRLASSQL